jgi:hypothetical protein
MTQTMYAHVNKRIKIKEKRKKKKKKQQKHKNLFKKKLSYLDVCVLLVKIVL